MSEEVSSCILPRTIDRVEQWYHFEHAAHHAFAHIHADDAVIAMRSATLKALRLISRRLHGEFRSMITSQMVVRSEYITRSDSAVCHFYI